MSESFHLNKPLLGLGSALKIASQLPNIDHSVFEVARQLKHLDISALKIASQLPKIDDSVFEVARQLKHDISALKIASQLPNIDHSVFEVARQLKQLDISALKIASQLPKIDHSVFEVARQLKLDINALKIASQLPRIDNSVFDIASFADLRVAIPKLSAVKELIEKVQLTHSLTPDMQMAEASLGGEVVDFLQGENLNSSLDFFDWASNVISVAELRYRTGEISKRLMEYVVSLVDQLIASRCVQILVILATLFPAGQPSSPVENYRQTNIEINLTLPQNQIASKRIVYRDANVHLRSRGQSRVVSFLFSGDEVEVLKARKKWRLVRWVDCDGEFSEGWVRAKYLKKVKPLSKHYSRDSAVRIY